MKDLQKCEQMSIEIRKNYRNKITSLDTAIATVRDYNDFD